MKTLIEHHSKLIKIDLCKPLDISISLRASNKNVNAWNLGNPEIKPVKSKEFVGSIKEGGSVNFNDIYFNPHAHGTHTECIGHITEKFHSINKHLKQFFFTAELISVAPENYMKDTVISKQQIATLLKGKAPEALVIRTLPNTKEKKSRHYSESNWTYLTEEAMIFIREKDIKHLLIDLPSVDREHDGGKLLAHKAFWNFDGKRRMDCTITEFIYVRNKIKDGSYMLDLQIAPFVNDATPSKPILYEIMD